MNRRQFSDVILNAAERLGMLRVMQGVGRRSDLPLYVLTYHRVDVPRPGSPLDPAQINATPEQFEAQMKLLADCYHPVGIEEVLAAVDGRADLPRDAVLVTVDDGYRDFRDTIFPIAMRHGVRPLLFVPTAFVGQGQFWWDRLYAITTFSTRPEIDTPIGRLPLDTPAAQKIVYRLLVEHLKSIPFAEAEEWVSQAWQNVDCAACLQRFTLNWDELRELAAAGAGIASHSHNHPIMSRIPLEQAREEIRRSQRLLQLELSQTLPVFAFPDGKNYAFNPALVQMLREEGIRLAFTMLPGCAHLRADNLLALPRFGAWQRLTLSQLHWRLTPLFTRMNKPA